MVNIRVNEQTELRLVDRPLAGELYRSIDSNRQYLRRWHPWVDLIQTVNDVDKTIVAWQQQHAARRGTYSGIWFNGRFCGVIGHLNVDWINRWTVLTYWLDESHQGKGIMTSCCRAYIEHAFKTWNLNRVTIECATENTRSRAIPERLGFKLEGIIREIEKLHDRHVDHAFYGLLRKDHVRNAVAAL